MGFYILSYLCIAVFALATLYRIYRQMTMPVHVRWEIYPVQHETSAKVAYGGSYMEEIDWWEKKQEKSLLGELLYMVPEILFIRGLWKENRGLWWVSFPFHFGLYMMIATVILLLGHAGFTLWGSTVFSAGSTLRTLLDGFIAVMGWGGLILGNIGSLGLLYRRWTDAELRNYSSPVDYFNLLFILLFFLSALVSCLSGDPFLEGAKAYVMGLLTGGHPLNAHVPGRSISGIVAIVSASLLVAYIPLTHMSHMFMKYFLYHNVKWDDAPNRRGGGIEAAVRKNLNLRPTWGAKHVGADGQKTWLDIASSAPTEEKK
ncbi:MAG: respiratory nitrate reductase subunit gamma [Deltaproteobacteria bacterium]|nr:respiratory nitrate reductase subunit gamma [Deltaproteobacteria bacterium]